MKEILHERNSYSEIHSLLLLPFIIIYSTVDAVKLEFTTGIVVDNTVNKPPPIQSINRQSTVDRYLSKVVESSQLIEKDTGSNSNFGDFDKKVSPYTKPVSIQYKDRMR